MNYNVRLPYVDSLNTYYKLCRKEIDIPDKFKAKLKCRYVNNNIPYLFIAPFKEEEAYLEPRILIFHDVIYPNEIETLKNLAKSQVSQRICTESPLPGGK